MSRGKRGLARVSRTNTRHRQKRRLGLRMPRKESRQREVKAKGTAAKLLGRAGMGSWMCKTGQEEYMQTRRKIYEGTPSIVVGHLPGTYEMPPRETCLLSLRIPDGYTSYAE